MFQTKSIGDGEYPLNAVAKTGNMSIARELVDYEANFRDAVYKLEV